MQRILDHSRTKASFGGVFWCYPWEPFDGSWAQMRNITQSPRSRLGLVLGVVSPESFAFMLIVVEDCKNVW